MGEITPELRRDWDWGRRKKEGRGRKYMVGKRVKKVTEGRRKSAGWGAGRKIEAHNQHSFSHGVEKNAGEGIEKYVELGDIKKNLHKKKGRAVVGSQNT